jgi:hypothetical protein
MNLTQHNSSQRWVNLKQQYAQWRQRAAKRKIARHAAEAACGGFGM